MRTYGSASPNRTEFRFLRFSRPGYSPSRTVPIAVLLCWLISVITGCGSGIAAVPGESLYVSPTALDFGDVGIGQSAVKTIGLSNAGQTAVSISEASFSSPAFSVVDGETFPISVPAGGTHSMSARFAPTAAIDYSTQLAFVDVASKTVGQLAARGRGQGPARLTAQMLVSANRMDFGSAPVNTPTRQTISLTSVGTAPLTVNSVAVSGAGFTIVGGGRPTATLSPDQSLTLTVQFNPTTTGSTIGQLAINSNSSSGATTIIALSGSGVSALLPQLKVSAKSVIFGNVTVNTSTMQTLTLTSTGTTPVTVNSAMIAGAGFTVVKRSFPATLNPTQSLTLQVRFNPVVTGMARGRLIIHSNSSTGRSVVIGLNGAGTPAPSPQLTVSSGGLSFGSVTVNRSTMKSLILTSTGTAPVRVNSVTIVGAGFTVVKGDFPSTLDPGQSLTLQLKFSPTVTGSAVGQLTINSDASTGGIAVVTLSGTSIAAPSSQLTVSSASLNFGSVTVNTSMTQSLTLTSTGTAAVTVNSATITGAGFAVVGGGLPATLNSGQSLTLQVRFSPTATGSMTGSLTIKSNSVTGGTVVVALSGSSTAAPNPQLSLSLGSLAFGNVTVNTTVTQFLTLTSTGATAVTVNRAVITGRGYSIAEASLPVTLNPGQSLTLQVQFSPTVAGAATGMLTINSNSTSGSAANVALSGTGTATNPQLTLSATNLSFGSVSTNLAITKTLILTSTGTSPLTISSATVTGAGFSLTGGSFPVTLNPGQSLTLQLRFLPLLNGVQAGQITIVSNSTGGAAVVSLGGTGTGGAPEVDLSWDAPTSSPVAVVGYNVYRSTGNSGAFAVLNSSSVVGVIYIDKAVVSGTSYTYMVKSVDTTGTESGPSNQIILAVP